MSHSKFIAISRLRSTHRPALFTTSTNITTQQLNLTVQSGVLFSHNRPLYQRFVREWRRYVSCSEHKVCQTVAQARNWQHYGRVAAYFSPDTIDPITNDLRRLDCTDGGVIEVASLWLRTRSMIAALKANRTAGCAVRVVIEHPEVSEAAVTFAPRVEQQHDKYLIVNTPSEHRVYVGTQDFGPRRCMSTTTS